MQRSYSRLRVGWRMHGLLSMHGCKVSANFVCVCECEAVLVINLQLLSLTYLSQICAVIFELRKSRASA